MAKVYISQLAGTPGGAANVLAGFLAQYFGTDVPNTINGYDANGGLATGSFNGTIPDVTNVLAKEEIIALVEKAVKDYAISLSFAVDGIFYLD